MNFKRALPAALLAAAALAVFWVATRGTVFRTDSFDPDSANQHAEGHGGRPTDEGPTVLNWGDARIGNIMWKDFRPVAVLDWEMASLGAPEVDLAWMLVLHRFFHDMANRYNMPGLPDLLERESSVRDYEDQIDHKVRDLEFYEVFAAQRFAIISLRTSRRAIEYGQMEPTDDPDGLVMHRGLMQQMLDGSYWS